MRKIALLLALLTSLAYSNQTILGELGTPKQQKQSSISFDAGLWYMTWDQTSTASDILQNSSNALDTTYNIDNTLASVINLNLNYKFLSTNIEYYNGNDVSGLNIGMSLLDLIPFVNIEAKYVKADFKGNITSKTSSTSAVSKGGFETKLEIIDLMVYPFNKYLGFGYRKYDYEVPQDLYLVNNTTGSLLSSGLDDLKYDGSFYTIVLDNKRLVDAKTDYNGLVYSLVYGMGTLSPQSTTDASLNKYYTESDAEFLDILLGYSYKTKSNQGFGYGLSAGYRYNKIDTSANTSGEYSLITEFNTEFHGPFVSLSVSY